MSIGTWEGTAIDVEVDALAMQRPILVAMFSDSWYKRFDLYILEGNPPQKRRVAYWDNSDRNQLHFTFKLERGQTYFIVPSYTRPGSQLPEPTDIAPVVFQGKSLAGQSRVELFEWDFGAPHNSGSPTSEKAGITLILVDNTVGPQNPVASANGGVDIFAYTISGSNDKGQSGAGESGTGNAHNNGNGHDSRNGVQHTIEIGKGSSGGNGGAVVINIYTR